MAKLRHKDDLPTNVGDWAIHDWLGAGGMGEVYVGTRLGEKAAVKVLRAGLSSDSREQARFRREYDAASAIDSPRVANLIDADFEATPPYIASRFYDAPTLKQLVADRGALPAEELAQLAHGLAQGIAAIHAAGTTHRDLKPSNVLMTDDGPVIIDFGIASVAEAATITQTGEISGTPGWMAPEQLNYEAVGDAVDVHGWGSLIQFAATTRGPFGEGSHEILMYRVGKGDPLPHDIDGRLGELVTAALNRDPDKRPSIQQIVKNVHGKASSGIKINGRLFATAAIVLCAALLGGFLYMQSPSILSGLTGDRFAPAPMAEPRASDAVSGPVVAAAFNSDGTKLVSGGVNEMAFIWDLSKKPTPRPIALIGHNNELFSVAFSPDDSLVASVSADQTIRLWDATSGDSVFELTGHTNQVRTVAFSPDGSILASGSSDSSIRIWDVASGKALRVLTTHKSVVRSIAFSPDGSRLVSASHDQTLRLWDVASGEQVGEPWIGHTDKVRAVAFSPTGNLVASGGGDNVVRLWNPNTGEQVAELAGHERKINGLSFNNDGSIVASSSSDRMVRLWNVEKGTEIRDPLPHNNWAWAVDFHPQRDQVLAVADSDGTVRLWDIETGQPAYEPLAGHTSIVSSVDYSPDGKRVVASVFLKSQLIDVKSGREVDQLTGHSDRVRGSRFTTDGDRIVSIAHDSKSIVWDASLLEPIGQPFAGHTAQVRSLTITNKGNRLITGGQDGTVRVWDLDSGTQLQELVGHSAPLLSVALHSNDWLAASSDETGTIYFWDINKGMVIREPFQASTGPVWTLAFSGDALVSGGSDGLVKIWNTSDATLSATFKAHKNHVRAIAADSTRGRIASAGTNGSIIVWDMTGGERIKEFTDHIGGVTSLAFSPDGNELVSGGVDGRARFWPLTDR